MLMCKYRLIKQIIREFNEIPAMNKNKMIIFLITFRKVIRFSHTCFGICHKIPGTSKPNYKNDNVPYLVNFTWCA